MGSNEPQLLATKVLPSNTLVKSSSEQLDHGVVLTKAWHRRSIRTPENWTSFFVHVLLAFQAEAKQICWTKMPVKTANCTTVGTCELQRCTVHRVLGLPLSQHTSFWGYRCCSMNDVYAALQVFWRHCDSVFRFVKLVVDSTFLHAKCQNNKNVKKLRTACICL